MLEERKGRTLVRHQISRLECWNRPWYCFLRPRSFKLFWEKEGEHNGTYSAAAYLMAGKTYSKCGQRLQALFLFVFIRQPQIPSSVGVWGNGLECWCQRYHGWERNAYFRVPLSLRCLQISLVSLSAADMPLAPSSSVSLIQCNNTGDPRAGKNTRVTGWMGTSHIITCLRLQIKTKCMRHGTGRIIRAARSEDSADVASILECNPPKNVVGLLEPLKNGKNIEELSQSLNSCLQTFGKT